VAPKPQPFARIRCCSCSFHALARLLDTPCSADTAPKWFIVSTPPIPPHPPHPPPAPPPVDLHAAATQGSRLRGAAGQAAGGDGGGARRGRRSPGACWWPYRQSYSQTLNPNTTPAAGMREGSRPKRSVAGPTWGRHPLRNDSSTATRLLHRHTAHTAHTAHTGGGPQVFRENVTGSVAMDFGGVPFTNAYLSLTNIVVTLTPKAAVGRRGLLIASHHDSAVASPGGWGGRSGDLAMASSVYVWQRGPGVVFGRMQYPATHLSCVL
jgi:hypothetical protein